MSRNVLFITVDQYRGDSLSCAGHRVVETTNMDALAARGVRFANHWANTAPCGPSRASIYTGMYMQNHRSVQNGTPLDARFTNIALEARAAGYDPVLFGYTDTSLDPRTLDRDDPSLQTYESVLPGFRAVVHDPYEAGSLEWGKWLGAHGIEVPSNPRLLYEPDTSFPGASDHGSTWAPTQFTMEHTETAFLTEKVIEWLNRSGEEPFFVHASYIRPHPPYRNPPGYHALYNADDIPDFTGYADRESERESHPLNKVLMVLPMLAAEADERDRRQLRATYHGMQKEVDDQLGRLFTYLDGSGLSASTLVVLTSDHGDMAGDHWLVQKSGYWDETYHVPLIVVDPERAADASRGRVVDAFTESVDVMPTILDWLGADIPSQCDGWSLDPFVRGDGTPEHWRTAAHFEWDFRNPATRLAETYLGIPMAHCSLNVMRNADFKYVQFAGESDVLPPLLFDLAADPQQIDNVVGDPAYAGAAGEAAQELLRWRMRNDERTLADHILVPGRGDVASRDAWR